MFEAAPASQMDTHEDAPPQRLSPEVRQKIAVQLLPQVKEVARRLARRLPDHVEVDELISAGHVGLLEALDKYDPSRSPPFVFCELRIRGAMLDHLRSIDMVDRNTRGLIRTINEVTRVAELTSGRKPSDGELVAELAVELGVDPTKLMRSKLMRLFTSGRLGPPQTFSIADVGDRELSNAVSPASASTDGDQFTAVLVADMRRVLTAAIESADINEGKRLVLELYYIGGLTLKEIARQLDVTESRICQIVREISEKLRIILEEYSLGDFLDE